MCPPETFKCRNGPCLNQSLVCDEKIDCPGTWVDEDGCCKLVVDLLCLMVNR